MLVQQDFDWIEESRQQMHEMVDRRFDELCARLRRQKNSVLPLDTMPALFKGTKVIGILFPDGREVRTPTWKKAALELLQDCSKNPEMQMKLKDLSGHVYGRQRVLLAKQAEGMDAPLKIADDLYFESKFDTEALLKVLKERIFDVIGYDYRGILLKIQPPKQNITERVTILPEEGAEEAMEEEHGGMQLQ